jgi:hypothetical protein
MASTPYLLQGFRNALGLGQQHSIDGSSESLHVYVGLGSSTVRVSQNFDFSFLANLSVSEIFTLRLLFNTSF